MDRSNPPRVNAAVNEESAFSSVQDDELSTRKSSDDKWEAMYRRLVRYYEAHGDTNVPSRYPDDPALGFWGKMSCLLPASF